MSDLLGTPEEECSFCPFSINADFMYYGQSFEDFSNYYSVIFEGDTYIGEYKNLLDYFKEPCEYLGGTLLSISGTQNCAGDEPMTYHTDNNFPYCAPAGCSVNSSIVEESESFRFCEFDELAEKNYQVEVVEVDILSSECKDQLQSFSSTVPTHPLAFDQVNGGDWVDFDVSVDGDGSHYDFETVVNSFKDICKSEGGYLYKFSDSSKGIPDAEFIMSNYPICLGSSCNAEVYFEELYSPTMKFQFDGNFRDEVFDDEKGTFEFGGNGTYPIQGNYEFIGFEAASPTPMKLKNKIFLRGN